jgi:AraC-like DNA-binding protein
MVAQVGAGSQVVSTLIVHTVLEAAECAGLRREELLESIGLDASAVAEPSCSLSLAQQHALFREILVRTGDEAFGVRAAVGLRRGAFRGLEYVIRASRTLEEGLRALARFGRLLHGPRLLEVRSESNGGAAVTFAWPHGDRAADLIADFALASVLVLCRDATGTELSPRRVRFRRRPPGSDALHRGLFRSPLFFGEVENALELSPDVLSTRMKDADPMLRAVLEEYLTADLEALDPVRSLADTVRTAIVRALPEQDATLEAVARDVGLSPRVLQKRLQAAGTSFQEQLDVARETLAKRYLLQPEISLSGAALRLGYSDVTAFHRAFKRWTGLTPGDFRRRAGEGRLEP